MTNCNLKGLRFRDITISQNYRHYKTLPLHSNIRKLVFVRDFKFGNFDAEYQKKKSMHNISNQVKELYRKKM